MSGASIPLFSYGTLQQRDVQLATDARELEGDADVLAGYRLEPLKIRDPAVIARSGRRCTRSRGAPATQPTACREFCSF